MAWAKSLVEYAIENTDANSVVEIPLKYIAQKYLKYYWNQTIFFDLIQGSNLVKPPVVLQIVKGFIYEYYKVSKTNKPIRFERAEEYIAKVMPNGYEDVISSIARVLKNDVSWRFLNIDGKVHEEIYAYQKENSIIRMTRENFERKL